MNNQNTNPIPAIRDPRAQQRAAERDRKTSRNTLLMLGAVGIGGLTAGIMHSNASAYGNVRPAPAVTTTLYTPDVSLLPTDASGHTIQVPAPTPNEQAPQDIVPASAEQVARDSK